MSYIGSDSSKMAGPMTALPQFDFDNSYARDMEGFYVPWEGATVPAPELVLLNEALVRDLGLDPQMLQSKEAAAIFAGMTSPDGASPLAQAYAGHQFGGFSPQLGDGRAILIGEIVDRTGQRRDIHLKGSGPTPFSRGGDGKAVIGPVLREYILGEAMYALGIPTTRALAAVSTGETIYREGPKPGAVLARVAASHLRVGTFQFFAARQEIERVRQLADYAIARHDPDLAEAEDKYLRFFANVVARQASLVAQWVLVGFVHGVMNTDNTTISGETIDYGPCAFIDAYDPAAVFSSIDHGGRYAYGRQPSIAQWNLARLAETLVGLIEPDNPDAAVEKLTEVLNAFPVLYKKQWLAGMGRKLGLPGDDEALETLSEGLLSFMKAERADYTQTFRALADAAAGNNTAVNALLGTGQDAVSWLENWRSRLRQSDREPNAIGADMRAVNPVYIPRNHMVEEALAAAETGDYGPATRLLAVLGDPFTTRPGLDAYAEPAPAAFGQYVTFCGT